ncbi:MAG TPA: nucleoside deaminase, partial [Acidobacteria bacterium]|nr:nucleoside deaminase [Acidobacteriota bacterium]
LVAPLRQLLAHGQRGVEVIGSVLEHEATDVHSRFWPRA